jgi:hypothetical protein
LTSKEIAAVDLTKFAESLVDRPIADGLACLAVVQAQLLKEIAYQFAVMNERTAPMTFEDACARSDAVILAIRDREQKT